MTMTKLSYVVAIALLVTSVAGCKAPRKRAAKETSARTAVQTGSNLRRAVGEVSSKGEKKRKKRGRELGPDYQPRRGFR